MQKPKLNVGDKVIKNPDTWVPNDFDSWGRGVGKGVVVEPPFDLDDDEVDVRWPNGRCFENAEGLILVEKTNQDYLKEREWNYYFNEDDLVTFDEYSTAFGDVHYDFFTRKEINFKNYIGKKGVIKKCWSDLHAFCCGSAYTCEVDFDGEIINCMAMYLVKYEK